MESNEVITALSALAHPVRLQVFRALIVAGDEGLLPGTMAQATDTPAATLSFHLKELLHAGLVTQQRHGRNLIYRARYAQMNALVAYLSANCCEGGVCELETPNPCEC